MPGGFCARQVFVCRRRRAPQQIVEIALPPMSGEIDATLADQDAFAREMAHLLAKTAAPRRKRNATVRAQHAIPRQVDSCRRFPQDATHQARAPRETRALGNFTVTGDATTRNRLDRSQDREMFGRHGRFRRRHGCASGRCIKMSRRNGRIGYAGQDSLRFVGREQVLRQKSRIRAWTLNELAARSTCIRWTGNIQANSTENGRAKF